MPRKPAPALHRSAATVLLLLGLLAAAFPAGAQRQAVQPLRPGDPFPAQSFKLFNPQGDSLAVDLAQIVGKKPVVLCYWIPGNPRAEAVFSQLVELTRSVESGSLALFGVAVANPSIGVTPDVIRERARGAGIDVPILNDEGFGIGQRLMVRSVPHITVIDASGRMQLSNGASLTQDLEYKVDLAAAIRRVAETGELHTYGFLPTYYPVKELEGQPAPDFKAPHVANGEERSWSGMLDGEKINVLVFWSLDCPHCRRQIPEIDSWYRENPSGANIVGAVTVSGEKDEAVTREYFRENELSFPNLFDRGARISELYGVTSTPTIVIVGPDGVVDTAITSSLVDFGSTMERKRKELLNP